VKERCCRSSVVDTPNQLLHNAEVREGRASITRCGIEWDRHQLAADGRAHAADEAPRATLAAALHVNIGPLGMGARLPSRSARSASPATCSAKHGMIEIHGSMPGNTPRAVSEPTRAARPGVRWPAAIESFGPPSVHSARQLPSGARSSRCRSRSPFGIESYSSVRLDAPIRMAVIQSPCRARPITPRLSERHIQPCHAHAEKRRRDAGHV
jgi:hypothetical protein